MRPVFLSVALLTLVACDTSSTATDPTPVKPTPSAVADGPPPTGAMPPAHGGIPPADVEPPPQGPADPDAVNASALCEFVSAESPVGGVVCPEGCVMIKAAPIDDERRCARVGDEFEVALACLRLPADIREGGQCYVNHEGFHVATALQYPGLAAAGWHVCQETYPNRAVPPCEDPTEAVAPE